MIEVFVEIWESVRRNKLRTCLTGFAVAWGIFMIIVLLGAGNGLMNAFLLDSDDVQTNYMEIYGGVTTKPYAGYSEGRDIQLEESDVRLTESETFASHIDDVSSFVVKDGYTLSYGVKHFGVKFYGVYPIIEDIWGVDILAGRFINQVDIKEQRKVIMITDEQARNCLRGSKDYGAMIGKYVNINDISFKVVGVRKAAENENDTGVCVPYTTLKKLFDKGNQIDELIFTFHGLETEEENEAFEKSYRSVVNLAHEAAPDDPDAIWIDNRFTQDMQINKAAGMLRTALWIVGLFTLLSGIVGVSNIMLITVKERTHEFGIRKAIGAKPWEIIKLILSESIVITAVFGYVGMFLGMVACEVLDRTLGHTNMDLMGQSFRIMENPTVGIDVAIEATMVLIIAGMIAGFIPARKASKVRPIEALKVE